MKFTVTKTSSSYDNMTIRDFPTIESLIAFMEEHKNPLVIEDNFWYKEDAKHIPFFQKIDPNELVSIPYNIEIYDDYRE